MAPPSVMASLKGFLHLKKKKKNNENWTFIFFSNDFAQHNV